MRRRALARLAFFARFAIALACFQLSGYGHLVTDVLASVGLVESHDDDCDDEEQRECPPGCPTCHCAHCVSPALPAPDASASLAPAEAAFCSSIRQVVDAPVTPEPTHVYRPPRATTLQA